MNGINGNSYLIRWSLRNNPVAQVEYMTLCLPGIFEQLFDPLPQVIFGQEQGNGIQVALDRVVTYTGDGLFDVDTPVKAEDVCAGGHRMLD